MKIIITGVSGFVGTNLPVYLSNHSYEAKSISVSNLTWKSNFIGDSLINLAGKAHDIKRTSEVSE